MGQRADFIIGYNIRPGCSALGVDPAGSDAGLLAAQNIRCQTVTPDHSLHWIKTGDPGKATVKIPLIRLVDADVLGDENILEEMTDGGTFQPTGLDLGGAVAGDVKLVLLA